MHLQKWFTKPFVRCDFLFYIEKTLFDEGGDKMFNIFEKKGQTIIQLTKGDSGTIWTTPSYDVNSNKIYDPENGDCVVELGDNDYVLFAVGTSSGRKYITKLLTKDDCDENHVITINLVPTDTVHLQPYSYNFSLTYFKDKGTEAFTYACGKFEVLETVGTIEDLPEGDADGIGG